MVEAHLWEALIRGSPLPDYVVELLKNGSWYVDREEYWHEIEYMNELSRLFCKVLRIEVIVLETKVTLLLNHVGNISVDDLARIEVRVDGSWVNALEDWNGTDTISEARWCISGSGNESLNKSSQNYDSSTEHDESSEDSSDDTGDMSDVDGDVSG